MRKVIKAILFILILVALIEVLNFVLIPKHKLFKLSNYEISGEADDSVDVVYLGDSLVYSSVSPMEIWNEYGFTSFDCAEAAQIIPDSYRYLEFAIENQHPKVVFMEANVLFRDPKKRVFKESVAVNTLRLLPIAKYHDNWKKYFEDKSNGVWVNVYKGFKYITTVESASNNSNYMAVNEEYNNIPEGNLDYFEKIIKLCEENDAKLILISFPSQKSWKYKKHNSTVKIAEQYNLDFIDLNLEDLGIDWSVDTKDKGAHLNTVGASKVSKFVGEYLKNSGLVEDHRNDENYESWNIAYDLYIKNANSTN